MNAETQTPSITRILLLGGGFAGIYTARRLEKLFWPRAAPPASCLRCSCFKSRTLWCSLETNPTRQRAGCWT